MHWTGPTFPGSAGRVGQGGASEEDCDGDEFHAGFWCVAKGLILCTGRLSGEPALIFAKSFYLGQ